MRAIKVKIGIKTNYSKFEALIAMLGKLTSGVLMKPLPCSRVLCRFFHQYAASISIFVRSVIDVLSSPFTLTITYTSFYTYEVRGLANVPSFCW